MHGTKGYAVAFDGLLEFVHSAAPQNHFIEQVVREEVKMFPRQALRELIANAMYLQIKSRFGDNPDEIFTATSKASGVVDNYSVAMIFCFFDVDKGYIWDYLWFVPAPYFLKLANQLHNGEILGFVAGRKKKESNKWDQFLMDKRELANQIIAQLKRL